MNVSEYAKSRGVSKQSVYDRLKRGTLQYEVINGVKNIIEPGDSKGLIQGASSTIESTFDKKLEKKLNKALKRLNKVEHKLALATNDVESLEKLLAAKDSEIETLKNTFGLMTLAIERKMIAPVEEVIEADLTKKKKKKKKK